MQQLRDLMKEPTGRPAAPPPHHTYVEDLHRDAELRATTGSSGVAEQRPYAPHLVHRVNIGWQEPQRSRDMGLNDVRTLNVEYTKETFVMKDGH